MVKTVFHDDRHNIDIIRGLLEKRDIHERRRDSIDWLGVTYAINRISVNSRRSTREDPIPDIKITFCENYIVTVIKGKGENLRNNLRIVSVVRSQF